MYLVLRYILFDLEDLEKRADAMRGKIQRYGMLSETLTLMLTHKIYAQYASEIISLCRTIKPVITSIL
jgi:hypothetical protein